MPWFPSVRRGALLLACAQGACAASDPDPSADGSGGSASTATSAAPSSGAGASSGSGAAQGAGSAGGGVGSGGAGGGTSAGGGGTGGGGTGGGGEHTIEVALRTAILDGDLSEVQVFISSVDGDLVGKLQGEELPAQVEVRDGDLVSFFAPYSDLTSYRVTPAVERIESYVTVHRDGPCEGYAPMDVTIAVPEVPGATHYEVQVAGKFEQTLTAPGEVYYQIGRCDDEPVQAMVTANEGNRVLSYERLEIPYVSGSNVSLAPRVRDTAREVLQIDVFSVPGVKEIGGRGRWVGEHPLRVLETALTMRVPSPPAMLSYAPAVLSPGSGHPHAIVFAKFPQQGDFCPTSLVSRNGSASEPIPFKVDRLRAPTPTDTSWTLGPEGELGDLLLRQATYVPDPTSVQDRMVWRLYEDPARPALPAIFPTLGDDAPPELQPQGPLQLRSLIHSDSEHEGYAASVASRLDIDDSTYYARSFSRCPDYFQ